jgi:hydrogenase small subunit
MPGFPDKFTPFYKTPPGSRVSTSLSRVLGTFVRPLRASTNEHLNREVRWDLEHHVPSGWAREHREPGRVKEASHKFYDRLRRSSDTSKRPAEVWGKRDEFTQTEDPALERRLPGGEDERLTIDDGGS